MLRVRIRSGCRDRLQLWTDSIAKTLIVRGDFDAVHTVAETGLFEAPEPALLTLAQPDRNV